jgi:hypothetical protein
MKKWILPLTLLLICASELMRVYFIMPFPGSQATETVSIAYFFDRNIIWLRLLLYTVVIWRIFLLVKAKKWLPLSFSLAALMFCGLITYYFTFKINAAQMFQQPTNIKYADAPTNIVTSDKLVIGVEMNGEAKAYPIEVIGYHHQIRDVIGGKEIMITYCTICRTGRVYDPNVNGKTLDFKLVGIDQFNAMFEDTESGSWWRQATGEAITGKLKGTVLTEFPSAQMTLQRWLELYPNSKILQPDDTFKKEYAQLENYDEGSSKSELETRSNLPWQDKSWVVSITIGNSSKAFDWSELMEQRLLKGEIDNTSFVVIMEPDNQTFHAYKQPDNVSLSISPDKAHIIGSDSTVYTMNGKCILGPASGTQLVKIPAYQEFYHAYKSFRE